jgi:hypothetical protein
MFGEALDPTTAEIAAAKNMPFAGLTPDGFGEMRLNVRLENWERKIVSLSQPNARQLKAPLSGLAANRGR